jgi:hypothetical protein
MSAAEWSGEMSELAKPPKKRVPTWVWGCGGGCLLMVVVALLLAAYGFKLVKGAADQDAQWARLGKHLPVDARPPGVMIFGVPFRLQGMSIWSLQDATNKQQAIVFQAPPGPKARESKAELFDATKEVSFMGFGRHGVEVGEVEVQGRRLHCVRYTSMDEDREPGPMDSILKEMQGASIAVDLAPEGSDELLALILTRQGNEARIEDAALAQFLAPFRIPGGTAPTPAETPAQPPAEQPDEGR